MAHELGRIANNNANIDDNPISSLASVGQSFADAVATISERTDMAEIQTAVGDNETEQFAAADTSKPLEELMGIPIVDSEDSKQQQQQQSSTAGPD